MEKYLNKLVRVALPDNERGCGYLGVLRTNGQGYWMKAQFDEMVWLGQPRLGYVTNFQEAPGQIIPRLQLWPQ